MNLYVEKRVLIGRTRLAEMESGLLVKFEFDNAGFSHKVRAASHIVSKAIQSGEIVPGETTVIEKTGGNFGFGLLLACRHVQVPVELAVGLSFSPIKRRYLELLGGKLIGVDQLKLGVTPKEVVEWHLAHAEELGKQYFYTDQFNNVGNLEAHENITGPEIVCQLQQMGVPKQLTFVSCAGTGAHLTGVTRALRGAGYKITVILVEPFGCDSKAGVFVDHKLEGVAVGVTPPLLDWDFIDETIQVDHASMLQARTDFAKTYGYFVGNSSAACISVARKVAARQGPEHKTLTIAYDHGLWYE